MVSIFYRQITGAEPNVVPDASNSGLRVDANMDVNGTAWTARSDDGTVTGPDVTSSKVLGRMYGEYTEVSRAERALPVSSRKLLDSFQHGNFSVGLFYERKNLCLELTDQSSGASLGTWTFCHDRRHQRLFQDERFSVRVYYRPAEVEVVFVERGQKGFIKRWFGSTLKSADTWICYELMSDGAVQINRPGKQYRVK